MWRLTFHFQWKPRAQPCPLLLPFPTNAKTKIHTCSKWFIAETFPSYFQVRVQHFSSLIPSTAAGPVQGGMNKAAILYMGASRQIRRDRPRTTLTRIGRYSAIRRSKFRCTANRLIQATLRNFKRDDEGKKGLESSRDKNEARTVVGKGEKSGLCRAGSDFWSREGEIEIK